MQTRTQTQANIFMCSCESPVWMSSMLQHPTATNISMGNSQDSWSFFCSENTAELIDMIMQCPFDTWPLLPLAAKHSRKRSLPCSAPTAPSWKPDAHYQAPYLHELFLPRQLLSRGLSKQYRGKKEFCCLPRIWKGSYPSSPVNLQQHAGHPCPLLTSIKSATSRISPWEKSGKSKSCVFSDFPRRNDAPKHLILDKRARML